jgi:NAD(P)H-hydrate epimerase
MAHLTASAALNRDIDRKMGLEAYVLEEERDWDKLQAVLRIADGIVDGIIGTGFRGSLTEPLQKLVQMVNDAGKPVLALDMPTGVSADTGAVAEGAVRATVTLALGMPKMGHFMGKGGICTGELLADDIGMPAALLQDEAIKQYLIDDEVAAAAVRPRPSDAYKGSCGRVLVVAGSRGLTGAAALASSAVLKAGAGISTLAIAESLHDIMETKLTEVMTIPLPEIETGIIGLSALTKLLELADSYDAILIGPGLGRHPETLDLVRQLARQVQKPLLLDADAIYAYRGHTDELQQLAEVPILTPHLGEMAGLLDIPVAELRQDILGTARKAAEAYHAIMVVKSECTLVVYPDGQAFVTSCGNPGMATAGSGDVLAGTIAGLFQQCEAGLAPLAGVYLHGRAGDMAAKEQGNGLIASDILAKLPAVRRGIEP